MVLVGAASGHWWCGGVMVRRCLARGRPAPWWGSGSGLWIFTVEARAAAPENRATRRRGGASSGRRVVIAGRHGGGGRACSGGVGGGAAAYNSPSPW